MSGISACLSALVKIDQSVTRTGWKSRSVSFLPVGRWYQPTKWAVSSVYTGTGNAIFITENQVVLKTPRGNVFSEVLFWVTDEFKNRKW